jgi:hypothetical protein
MIVCFFIFAGSAFAQQTPADTTCNAKSRLAWEMNSEADMAKYTIYHSDAANINVGGVGVTAVDVAHDPTQAVDNGDGTKSFETTLVLTKEGTRYFRVSASDTSDNESPLSNEIGCTVNLPPGEPSIELRFVIQASGS